MTEQHDEGLPVTPLTTEEAYGRFVPRQFLNLLGRPSIVEVELGDNVEQQMTLLFSDIRDFTVFSESILPAENFRFINSYLRKMEPAVSDHKGFIDKYIGDGIMALFPTGADDAVRCGIEMLRRLVDYNEGRARAGYIPIRIGIGINTGLVMMGTVGGHNRMDSTVIGDAVNKASRLEGYTKSYGISFLISEHTLHSLANPREYCIRFIDRMHVKGRYPAQSIYEVFDADPELLWQAKQETREMFEEALAYYHMGNPAAALPLLEKCNQIVPDDHATGEYLDRCHKALRAKPKKSAGSQIEVEWCGDYSVGIEIIDRQNRRMLELINELAHAVEATDTDTGGGAGPAPIMAEMARLLASHLSTEENIMRRYTYPFRTEHQFQHQAFVNAFEALRSEIAARRISTTLLLFRIQLMLVDWNINHITKYDVHLGIFLLRAGLR